MLEIWAFKYNQANVKYLCIYTVSNICTGYVSEYGNMTDNFEMLWNIGKIFGMSEDLIATNTATRHFFDWWKIRPEMNMAKVISKLLRNESLLKWQ